MQYNNILGSEIIQKKPAKAYFIKSQYRRNHKRRNKHKRSIGQAGAYIGPLPSCQRNIQASQIRDEATYFEKNIPIPEHPTNGDEEKYKNKIGNYSKALPHNKFGEVDLYAYKAFKRSITTGNPIVFEEIPLGGDRKLSNPQGSYAYELAGADSHHLGINVPPSFSSAWIASEMAEVYWMSLVRDVPFTDYCTNPLTIKAAKDLSSFSAFKGPKEKGMATPMTLFRSGLPGTLVGPYLSQFLLLNIPYGAGTFLQQYNTTLPNEYFMTKYNEWLNIQNGLNASKTSNYESSPRYVYNGRGLSEWVHVDFTYQAYLSACLILLNYGREALSPTNPYLQSKTQIGFVTFGAAHMLDFTARAARLGLEAAWFQKFQVHRRLRPEEYGGCVDNVLRDYTNYPINSEILNSSVVDRVYSKFGSYLLPMAYPEGCPTHPAYPAGHATTAGAAVTILKAFFNENYVIPEPVIPDPAGLSLKAYKGEPLTVGGELNKLASNISLGRDMAGVHWRSDGIEGMKLGETVAIRLLQDYKNTYNENFAGFRFTKFDGTHILI